MVLSCKPPTAASSRAISSSVFRVHFDCKKHLWEKKGGGTKRTGLFLRIFAEIFFSELQLKLPGSQAMLARR